MGSTGERSLLRRGGTKTRSLQRLRGRCGTVAHSLFRGGAVTHSRALWKWDPKGGGHASCEGWVQRADQTAGGPQQLSLLFWRSALLACCSLQAYHENAAAPPLLAAGATRLAR